MKVMGKKGERMVGGACEFGGGGSKWSVLSSFCSAHLIKHVAVVGMAW